MSSLLLSPAQRSPLAGAVCAHALARFTPICLLFSELEWDLLLLSHPPLFWNHRAPSRPRKLVVATVQGASGLKR